MDLEDLRLFTKDFIEKHPHLKDEVETIYDNAEIDIEINKKDTFLIVHNAVIEIEILS